jgi:CHASE3 domain sensor protein
MAAFKKFLGLIAFFVALFVLAGLAFVVYSIVNEVTDTTKKKMEKKNISLSKEGMQVKMKQRTAEQESDATQK